MLMEKELDDLQKQLEQLFAGNDQQEISQFLNAQNISTVAELIYEMPEHESVIMEYLSLHRAISTFRILEFPNQKRIIQSLSPLTSAELLNELPADDRTAFLEELPTEVVREMIKRLDPEERKITLSLLGYAEDSVGRLMTPDYLAIQEEWTVKQVLEHIRKVGRDSETIDVLYIVNKNGELIDDIRIREFLFAPPEKTVRDMIDGRFIALHVNDDQESANNVFKMNNRTALPVVDDQNILLGIVTIDDVLWVASEEFTEDIQKFGGTSALNKPYLDVSILDLVRKRAGWLIVLFIGQLFTATVMEHYEDQLASAVMLFMFIPLIISSGGNTGSQASTLIIQAMALGEITLSDWWRVMRREIISGLLLGLVLGMLGMLRIFGWHLFSDVYGTHWWLIGLTVSVSLTCIVLWGSLMGAMLPFILRRLGADPASSSAPFVSTLVDVTGLIIYFSVAWYFLQGVVL